MTIHPSGMIEIGFGPRDFPILVDYKFTPGDSATGVPGSYRVYHYFRADGKQLASRTLKMLQRCRQFQSDVDCCLSRLDFPE